ncbi:hypothetical protein RchiOBHm_Chr4g0408831 [Rosa chinensis]|uniref:Uncharacterized protein n=1 Tax=Rosa chinensis TaxID=74649 RepID=A0A2P6QUX8_ROSCH|nr:hypothetical protein RchiOBHm_Chr4g0408831 [Rosa chinensis]
MVEGVTCRRKEVVVKAMVGEVTCRHKEDVVKAMVGEVTCTRKEEVVKAMVEAVTCTRTVVEESERGVVASCRHKAVGVKSKGKDDQLELNPHCSKGRQLWLQKPRPFAAKDDPERGGRHSNSSWGMKRWRKKCGSGERDEWV